MTTKKKPADHLDAAIAELRKARQHAKNAHAVYTRLAISRAIKSAEGARNHARGREQRPGARRVRTVTRPRGDSQTAEALIQAIKDSQTVRLIVLALDGTEWSADTCETIAEILRGSGRPIGNSDEYEGDDDK